MKKPVYYVVTALYLSIFGFILTYPTSLAFAEFVKEPIVLGQSCALSGPAKDLGTELRNGLLTAFAEINDAGGVNGRELLLESYDDGYEPYRAVMNTEDLIDKGVFALIGEVGTPTSKAVLPLISKHNIPFFSPYTGAELLRTPHNPLVINIRASYFREMEKLVYHLAVQRKLSRIACFYQNDSYGFAGLEGLNRALAAKNLTLVGKGNYERNTVAVLGGLRDIDNQSPEAIVLVGAYPACAEFIKLYNIRNPGNDVVFANISFVGTKGLKQSLGDFGDRVIVSQVVPFPWDNSIPLVQQYHDALKKYRPSSTPGFVSLEGYIAGRFFGYIAANVKGELTREKFIKTVEELGHIDFEGIQLLYKSDNFRGSDEVFIISIYPDFQKISH